MNPGNAKKTWLFKIDPLFGVQATIYDTVTAVVELR